MTPNATFNVRYAITAFPYFCLLVGTTVASLDRTNKTFSALALVALIGISATSLYNRFTNPRYANEDIRSAVAFWRQNGGDEGLIAFGSPYPAHRYVAPLEAKRLFTVGGKDIVSLIEQVFVSHDISSAYVVLARDWDRAGETAIRNAFGGTLERSFPGVQVFRISSPKTFRTSDPSAASAPSHQP